MNIATGPCLNDLAKKKQTRLDSNAIKQNLFGFFFYDLEVTYD